MTDWVPPRTNTVLARNGYALLGDLEVGEHIEILKWMEGFQADFIARTRGIWRQDWPVTGDTLYNFSRQWEYPYAWSNLGVPPGKVLDAGSGITFFPFLLAAAGFEVEACDTNALLAAKFEQARSLTGYQVAFTLASITTLPYRPSTFDSAICISVLEHVGKQRPAAIRELARVLKPGGRLVLTCDLSLSRDSDTILEDLALVVAQVVQEFELVHPLDLSRPPGLLTSDYFRMTQPWRLPWRPFPSTVLNILRLRAGKRHFHSIAVLGLTLRKKTSE
jgi:SAM-dependent methyltransferase